MGHDPSCVSKTTIGFISKITWIDRKKAGFGFQKKSTAVTKSLPPEYTVRRRDGNECRAAWDYGQTLEEQEPPKRQPEMALPTWEQGQHKPKPTPAPRQPPAAADPPTPQQGFWEEVTGFLNLRVSILPFPLNLRAAHLADMGTLNERRCRRLPLPPFCLNDAERCKRVAPGCLLFLNQADPQSSGGSTHKKGLLCA